MRSRRACRYIDLPLGLVGLTGIVLGLGGLVRASSLPVPSCSCSAFRRLVRSSALHSLAEWDKLIAGVVFGLGGLAVIIFGVVRVPEYWWTC